MGVGSYTREVFILIDLEPYKGIAGIYEEVRPSYPEKLIHDIISITKLKSDDRILEIGAGTGKAFHYSLYIAQKK